MGKYKVSILGTGFIGLCSAACFADRGIYSICSTHDQKKHDQINQGRTPFYENGLEDLVKKAVSSKMLRCTLDQAVAVLETDISMITTGTPMREDKSINLNFVKSTAKEIGEALVKKNDYHLVVVRSTVVPGTTMNLVGRIITETSGKKLGKDFGLVMQPEFLAEGRSIQDTLYPDRIIIGELDQKSGDILVELYEEFYGDHFAQIPIIRMNIESAELVKYGNNILLATKITYANELANIAEYVPGVDITHVMKAVGLDYRINELFLGAGVGFGGACFHKDLNALLAFGREHGYESRLLDTVLNINDEQAEHIVEIVEKELTNLKNKQITILGLSFKPGTDDMRHAPSIRIINELIKKGATIIAYDPRAIESAKAVLKDKINYRSDISSALQGSDCAILVTEWDEFKALKPENFIKHMKNPLLVDGRRIYDPKIFSTKMKFKAIGLGKLD
ncbi:MAG: UDP-glucose dehydrogenase family protein [Promethearchaeota archaeon]